MPKVPIKDHIKPTLFCLKTDTFWLWLKTDTFRQFFGLFWKNEIESWNGENGFLLKPFSHENHQNDSKWRKVKSDGFKDRGNDRIEWPLIVRWISIYGS